MKLNPFKNPANTLLVPLCLAAMVATSGAYASGGGGNDYFKKPVVDRMYENGKAWFNSYNGSNIKYCVLNEENWQKVSRRTLKPYKNTSAEELTANLADCSAPDRMISDNLSGNQVDAVVYYLNKRYRLSLYNS